MTRKIFKLILFYFYFYFYFYFKERELLGFVDQTKKDFQECTSQLKQNA